MTLPFFVVVVTLGFLQALSPSLRIVVLEGEDAVNIVQQKTAVRPLVEVRDRNNVPVSGASVTFTVGTGQPAAFAGGAQTITVTTNASGQAAATGFNATGAGKVTVQVQAAHQGQTASMAITQTNFLTAAAATAAGVTATAVGTAAGSTGAGAGAVAGTAGTTGAVGAGGGLSLTTIALVGGAVAGGAVAAQQTGLIGGPVSYTGTVSGQYVWTSVFPGGGEFGGNAVCNHTRSVNGPMTIELNDEGTSGRATFRLTHEDLSVAGFRCNFIGSKKDHGLAEVSVSGGPSALVFSGSETTSANGGTATHTYNFTGALSGNTIAGNLSFQTRDQSGPVNGQVGTGSGSFTIPVTLQR